MKRLVVLLFGLVGAALFMSAANSGDRVPVSYTHLRAHET